MDGILTDWVGHTVKLFDIPEDHYFQLGCWDMTPAMLDYLKIHSQEFWLKQTPEFWATMPWTPYGKELLALCENHIGIDQCRIVSTPANAYSAHGKLWWLEYNMPYYHDRRHYHLTHLKYELAAPYKLLIDDSDKNIAEWRAHGGRGILFPTKYNSGHVDLGSDLLGFVNDEIRKFINS